jgi:flagellar biogenesis protein FliO
MRGRTTILVWAAFCLGVSQMRGQDMRDIPDARGRRAPAPTVRHANASPQRGAATRSRRDYVFPPSDEPVYDEPQRANNNDPFTETRQVTHIEATDAPPLPGSAQVGANRDAEASTAVSVSTASNSIDEQTAAPKTVLNNQQAIPLSPRKTERSTHNSADKTASPRVPVAWSSLITVGVSLGLVLGLFFFFAWLMRRGVPGAVPLLPKHVVDILGRAPLPGRQQMQLIRLGNKLILVHVSLAGAEALAEITDAVEVDRIVGLCQQNLPQSSTRAFRDVLNQLGRDRHARSDDFGLELASSRGSRRGQDRRRDLDG